MLGKRRLTVATVAVLAGAGWAVFIAPSSQVAAAPAKGATVRASVHDGTDAQAPDSSFHSQISADGSQVAFVGQDNLTDLYNNGCCTNAIYVRDSTTGHTVQISVGTEQLPAGGLVPDGTAPNGSSDYPSLSSTGRYVSFVTQAFNIVGHDDTFPFVIVVCDRDPDGDGVFDEQRAGSPAGVLDYRFYKIADIDGINDNRFPDGFDGWPHLSGDATQIVWGDSNPGSAEVRTAPLEQNDGSIGAPTSVFTVPTTLATQDGKLDQPQISNDGRYIVARWTHVSTVTTTAIVLSNVAFAGFPNPLTEIDASDTTPGQFQGGAGQDPTPPTRKVELPAISDFGNNGRVAAFDSYPVSDDTNPQAYAVNPLASASTIESTRISKPFAGGTGDGLNPTLSADGRYAAFVTDRGGVHDAAQPDVQPNATCINENGVNLATDAEPCQIVERDLVVDAQRAATAKPYLAAQLASVSINQDCGDQPANAVCPGDFDSTIPSLSGDGGKAAFESDAEDLVQGDDNRICDSECQESCSSDVCGVPARDVFVRTWTPSTRATKDPLDVGRVHVGQSKAVHYTIRATGFGPQQISGMSITPVTGDGLSVDDTGCITSQFNPFHEGDKCTVTVLFAPTDEGPVRGTLDVQTSGEPPQPLPVITGTGTAPLPPTVTPHEIVRTSVGDGDPGQQADNGSVGESMVSGDGRYDVFVSSDPLDGRPTHDFDQVYVRDLRTNLTQQISLGADVSAGKGPVTPNGDVANGSSDHPTISADGRLITFVTDATNIVPSLTDVPYQAVVVVCDRDPDGDGVFDEPQAARPGVPDLRCFAVHSSYEFGHSVSPRISPDGQHLVYIQCAPTEPADTLCFNTEQIVLVRLTTSGSSPAITRVTDVHPLVVDQFQGNADRDKPQVSNEGLFGDPHGVRVVYQANESFAPTAIFGVDVATTRGAKPYRIDLVPGSKTRFLGQDDTAQVADPSITDDGSVVAFDRENFLDIAEVYLARVRAANNITTRDVAQTKNGDPVRASDPALSGDGRYVSYVTDTPNFDGSAQTPPNLSCLVNGEEDFAGVRAAAPGVTPCQIVARDLVLDASRASAGFDPLPDALVTVGTPCSSPPTIFGSTCVGDDDSIDPSMDGNGGEVGFDSYADDLVPKDTNGVSSPGDDGKQGLDAFVRTFFPTAALSPVNFGNVPVGSSSSQTETLTVNGFGPYQLAGATVGGANPGDFGVTGATCALPGQLLHIDETCELSFTFTPGAKGPRTGTVTVSGENNPNTTTVKLTGNGAAATGAMFSADPDPVRFGSGLPLDKPGRTRKVTITNAGGAALIVNQVTVVDGSVSRTARDYAVDTTACGVAIPAGSSCKIKITWVGHAVGPRPAILRFVDNAPGGVQMVRLFAFVSKPSVKFTPSVVPTGRLTSVSGRGFAPRRGVLITLPDSGETATAQTSRHGNFTTPLIIFPNGILGHRTVQVRTVHADKSISAKKPLLVVLGTLQSPTLVIRH